MKHTLLYISIVVASNFNVQSFSGIPYDHSRASATSDRLRLNERETAFSLHRLQASDVETEAETGTTETKRKPCFYKPVVGVKYWVQRKHLNDLKLGDELSGYLTQDYLEGKSGPKLFFECGVGCTDRNGNWTMVSGMLRLDRSKLSVSKKRTARLRKQKKVQLYVSRIFLQTRKLEVCLTPEEVIYDREPKIPISTLKPLQIVEGTVVRLEPYGAMIDVGANRLGLIHIQKVADLYAKYIDKKEGLAAAGLERGAKVRLQVASNEKKRLSLDFTDEVKAMAREEREEEASRLGRKVGEVPPAPQVIPPPTETKLESTDVAETTKVQAQESTETTATASDDTSSNANDQGDYADYSEYDDYAEYAEYADDNDEDRDIEDKLGLGTY